MSCDVYVWFSRLFSIAYFFFAFEASLRSVIETCDDDDDDYDDDDAAAEGFGPHKTTLLMSNHNTTLVIRGDLRFPLRN